MDAERAQALGLEPGEYLALLMHSGSRGTGAQVCDFYSKRAMARHEHLPKELKHLAWLSLDDADGQEYWAAMNLMGRYAAANRSENNEDFDGWAYSFKHYPTAEAVNGFMRKGDHLCILRGATNGASYYFMQRSQVCVSPCVSRRKNFVPLRAALCRRQITRKPASDLTSRPFVPLRAATCRTMPLSLD